MCRLQNFSVCNIVEAAIALFFMSMEEECLFKHFRAGCLQPQVVTGFAKHSIEKY